MADLKISQLPTLTTPTDGDLIPVVNGGVTKNITFANLSDPIISALNTGSLLLTGSALGDTITLQKADGNNFNLTIDNVDSSISSSFSNFALTASYAVSASHEIVKEVSSSHADVADVATTSSYILGSNVDGIVASSSYTENALSASYAVTASYLIGQVSVDTGSLLLTGSILDDTITLQKADSTTFSLQVNNVSSSISSSYSLLSDQAISSSYAISASYSVQSDQAISSSYAISASLALDVDQAAQINIATITASSATFTTASIGYLQSITGSIKTIGDEFILLNTNLPTARYGGIKIIDSGSTQTTASLQFDAQTNDWFYEYEDGTTDYGIVLFGPEYNTKGIPTYPTDNKIQKGNGGHHLLDSNITDDGTKVYVDSDLQVTGSITASAFSGTFKGIADFAVTASYAISASHEISYETSSSYAETASLASTASYILGSNVDGQVASASLAVSASHLIGFEPTSTGSLLQTGSVVDDILTFGKGDGTTFDLQVNNVSSSISSSFATTASFAQTIDNNIIDQFATTGSNQFVGNQGITGSVDISGSLTITDVLQADYLATANYPDDATAASNGIPVNGVYRSGNFLVVRLS